VSLRGFDAFGALDGAAVVQAHGDFVIRYVGVPGNPKCIMRAELASHLRAGVRVGFVFESTATRATEGFQAGVADANAVRAHLEFLGVSPVPLVFFAVDVDVTFPQVKPYFQGVSSVMRADAYGDYQVIHALLDNNLVTEVWQTPAWSRGVIEPNAIVFQRVETAVVGGVECDVNIAQGWGRWAYPPEQGADVERILLWRKKSTQEMAQVFDNGVMSGLSSANLQPVINANQAIIVDIEDAEWDLQVQKSAALVAGNTASVSVSFDADAVARGLWAMLRMLAASVKDVAPATEPAPGGQS
jgi:hypothetical protein